MNVRIEKKDRVTTVILDRPEKRNAVDRPTATALADAFRAFEADPDSAVAVLWGAGGHFCAGADLGALTDESRRNRISPEGDGPALLANLHERLRDPACRGGRQFNNHGRLQTRPSRARSASAELGPQVPGRYCSGWP